MVKYDIIISGGLYFDGHNNESQISDLGIRDGIVQTVSKTPLKATDAAEWIDASGKWVMPGFIDIHTHYDIEVLVEPKLSESVRHGVTTIITGSCSLSAILSSPLDCADMFSRVEALPRQPVLSILQQEKTWNCPKGFVLHLKQLALGPNVASMLGHSDLRAHVLGLGRALDKKVRPSVLERERMQELLQDALDLGFVGMSTMTNPWDKLDGDRYRSAALPSTYASWSEYGWLNQVRRKEDRVVQSAPNLNTKINFLLFFLASMPLPWRRALKTTLLSATDPKASKWLGKLFGPVTVFLNQLLGSKVLWQALPVAFEIYADGMELVVFEEFGAGRAALHIRDELQRNELLKDESYRRQFRADYEKRFTPRIWHRDLHDAYIISCPEISLVGRSFGAIADERNLHPADVFLDLVVRHGSHLRWKTLIANHRPEVLQKILASSVVHIGFADSGAHLRNMGFYNFPLHFLKMVHDAKNAGRPFMSLEMAVSRLTKDLANFFNLDAGSISKGDRADIVVIDPQGLDDALSGYHEEAFIKFDGIKRMVRRNDRAVPITIINGRIAFRHGQFADDFGKTPYGRFLSAVRA